MGHTSLHSGLSNAEARPMVTTYAKHADLIRDLDQVFANDAWENEIVSGFARRSGPSLWTVLFQDFSIRTSGGTLHEALDAAGSALVMLIFDEAHRSSRASLSLSDLRRPIETRKRVKWEVGALVSRALSLVADDEWFEVKSLRVPLAHAICTDEPVAIIEAPAAPAPPGDGDDDLDGLMAEGYRELADDLLAFAEDSAAAAAEIWPAR